MPTGRAHGLARFRFRVPEDAAGQRLDRVLAGRPEVASRALAVRLIARGEATVDGRALPKSHLLQGGEEIEADVPAETPLEPEPMDLVVRFEDEHLLVVDKPAGMVVHPAGATGTGTLVQGLLERGVEGGDDDRPGIVHRLDRDTSGLLVAARSADVHAALQELVRRRELERRYLALVHGRPRSRTGRIEAPIGRDRHDRSRHSLDTATPRDAVTWFEVRELLGDRALLDIRLETGRTHQIRVHLEAIGLPVCGDPVYGVEGDLGLERQFLHAYRLRFVHPVTGDTVDVSSQLPPDLERALERARSE